MLSDPKIQQMFLDIDNMYNNVKKPVVAEIKDVEEGEIAHKIDEDKPEEVSSGPRQNDLETCLNDPYFAEVVNLMLQLVGVRDEDGNSIA